MFKPENEILDKRYRIITMIGSGAFGEIYSVEKKLTKEIYAMKVERAIPNQK